MHVTIRHYDGVKTPDEVTAKVRSEFLPIISKIPGFKDYYAIKTGVDTLTSVSIFKDKPGGEEAVKAATKWVETSLSKYLPNAPKVFNGEVVAHTSGAASKVAA